MAFILADRILESSTTTGTGVFTLAGAVLGFRSFASVCSVSDTCWYYVEGVDAFGKPSGEYEYGLGTYSGANQLTRTTVRGSSNGGSAVNFTAGIKLVGVAMLAPGSVATKAEWLASFGAASAGANIDITSLASPYVGSATTNTAAADTATTQVASTAFVIGQASIATPLPETAAGSAGVSKRYSPEDHSHAARSIGSHMSMVSYFGSRGLSSTYTNSANWPIVVMISAAQSGGGAAYLRASIPSTSFFLDSALAGAGSGGLMGLTFVVPAGASFRVECPTGPYATITNWQQFQ